MKKNKGIKPKKLYVAIGKIGNAPDGSAICIKHWLYNVDKYVEKVVPKFQFRWINFYYNTGINKGIQFKSWTQTKGLHDPKIK